MRAFAAAFLLTAVAGTRGALYLPDDATDCDRGVEGTIYDFDMKDVLENGTVSLKSFQKRVTLVVNVATY